MRRLLPALELPPCCLASPGCRASARQVFVVEAFNLRRGDTLTGSMSNSRFVSVELGKGQRERTALRKGPPLRVPVLKAITLPLCMHISIRTL